MVVSKNSSNSSNSRGSFPSRHKAAIAAALKKSGNPFDKFANSKKKHEVLNRRVKGEDRNMGRALAKSVEIRKKKLLLDYQRGKKSNSIIDKRFGENDADMTLEEKMLARFQKERMKSHKNRAMFNLEPEGDELQLTHKGKVLTDGNLEENEWSDDENDENDALDKDIVNQLHFGGGMVKRNSASENQEGKESKMPFQSNHMTALQEIVAKSKLHKLQKKEMKEEQVLETEKLDADFQSLLKESLIEYRDNNDIKSRKRSKNDDGSSPDDDYDKALHLMTYEPKLTPTDRTKSQEEIAIENREKLDELEKQRLQRMKESYQPNSILKKQDDAEIDGYERSKRRKGEKVTSTSKAKTDDELDDSFGAKMELINQILADEDEEDDGEDDDGDEEDDDDEEEDGDEEDGDEDVEDEDEEEEDGEDDDGEEEDGEDDNVVEDENEDDDVVEDENDESSAEMGERYFNGVLKNKSAIASNDHIPHKIACPEDFEAFDSLLQQHAKSAKDVSVIIDRIIMYNSVHLPGSLGKENRSQMKAFLNILLKHFIRVGDSLPKCTEVEDKVEAENQLNHLTRIIFNLCNDLNDVVGAVWGRVIKDLHSQFTKRLRDYALGVQVNVWPSLGNILLFQLISKVFSVSDFRHMVVEAACFYLSQCLTQSPVNNVRDLSSGMLIASILIEMSSESKKWIPECSSFIASTVGLFASTNGEGSENFCVIQKTFNTEAFAEARRFISTKHMKQFLGSRLQFDWAVFRLHQNIDVCFNDRQVLHQTLSYSFVLIDALCDRFFGVSSFPELFQSHLVNLAYLRPKNAPKLDKHLCLEYSQLMQTLLNQIDNVQCDRQPLKWRKVTKASMETKNPRYTVDYKLKKDNDPDENRVKLKQLTREKKREEKAVMRELRRDSDFLEQEKFKEKVKARELAQNERFKNFAWLEEQQASMNQQVRKGGELLRGGGSGVSKKARVKRM